MGCPWRPAYYLLHPAYLPMAPAGHSHRVWEADWGPLAAATRRRWSYGEGTQSQRLQCNIMTKTLLAALKYTAERREKQEG